MKRIILTLMLLVAATVAICAQDVQEQTDIPVLNSNVDVFSATIEISHDDPEAVIYWRYNFYDLTGWTDWSEWTVYTEPVEFSFIDHLYVIDYQIECFALSPGKTASEIVDYGFNDVYVEYGYPQVTPPLVYAHRVDGGKGLAVRIVDGLFGENIGHPYAAENKYSDYNYLLHVAQGRYVKPEHYYYKINGSDEWIEYDGEIYLDQYGEYKITAKTTSGNLEREVAATVIYDSTRFISQSESTIVCDGLVYSVSDDNTASVPDYYVDYLWQMVYPIIAPQRPGEIVIPGVIHVNDRDYTVNRIGYNALDGFTGVSIPSTVTSIIVNRSHLYSHEGYPNLASLTVEEGNPVYDSRDNCNAVIETASNELILGCYNTVIPGSVTVIGSHAFYFCNQLTSITIPSSVTDIEDAALYCGWLSSVVCYPVTPPSVMENSFFVLASPGEWTTTLYVPAESLEAYRAHEQWGRFSRIVPFIGAGPGDANGDGVINVSDVTSLIDLLLSGEDEPAWVDVNGDGVVNVSDVTTLIDQLLAGD